jgi:hypothetical protein
LTEFRTLVALAALPAVGFLVVDWGGAGFRWVRKNHSIFLPPEIKSIEEKRGRFLQFFKYAILFLVLWGLTGRELWRIVPVTAPSQTWSAVIASGIFGGLLAFGFWRVFALTSASIASGESDDYVLRGAAIIWLLTFAVGAFSEEFWRALCISSFQQNGHSPLSADLLSGSAFSIAHMTGIPSRIPGGLAIAGAELVTGLMFGAVYVWSGNLVSPCLASAIYYISNFYWLRRTYFNPIA